MPLRRRITRCKVPRSVRLVEARPMTVTGRMQNLVMRDILRQELKLVEEQTA